jgi:hypothetical protein
MTGVFDCVKFYRSAGFVRRNIAERHALRPLLDEDYAVILLRRTMHNFASAPCRIEWLLNYCAFVTAQRVSG